MEKFTILFLIINFCSEIWSFQCYSCSEDQACQFLKKIDCTGNVTACYSIRYSPVNQDKGCQDKKFQEEQNEICKKMNRRSRIGVPFEAYCLRCQSENCNICNNNDVCTKEELDRNNKPYYEQKDEPSPNRRMSCYECTGNHCEYEFGSSRVVSCYEGECFAMQNQDHFMQGCIKENMFDDFYSYCKEIDASYEKRGYYCKICNNTQNCNQRFIYDPKYDPKRFNLQYTKNTTDDDKLKCYNCTKMACETQHFAIEVCEASVRDCYVMYRNNIPYKMGCNTKGLTLEKCRDTVKHQYCNMCKKDYCNSSILITTNFNLIILFLFVFSLLKI